MNDFNKFLNTLLVSEVNTLSPFDIFVTITLPFLLCLVIVWFYQKTLKSSHYSQSFTHAILLFAPLTSIITLLIGSNIARAFGLVGALSLIRFRTAVKNPLDAVYMFWALSVGMACGTGFFLASIYIVVLGCLFMFLASYFDIGKAKGIYCVLKIKAQNIDKKNLSSDLKSIDKKINLIDKINILVNSKEKIKTHVFSLRVPIEADFDQISEKLSNNEKYQNIEILNTEANLFI